MVLKYGETYNLNIAGEDYKGIYLGNTAPRKKLKLNYVFLINNEDIEKRKANWDSLKFPWYFPYFFVRTRKYSFDENNNIILKKRDYNSFILPSPNERVYLEELLQRIK